MKDFFDALDQWVFDLLVPLQGMNGLALLIFILLLGALFYVARAESPRRDSKRRNQARRVK